MKPWIEVARELLAKRGPMRLGVLADALVRSSHTRIEIPPVADLFVKAINGEDGLVVAGYPAFRLSRHGRGVKLPRRGWIGMCHEVLLQSGSQLPLDDLYNLVRERVPFQVSAICPQWVMYQALTENGEGLFRMHGAIRIGPAGANPFLQSHPVRRTAAVPAPRMSDEDSVPLQSVHEAHVESILSENPCAIEPGLSLIRRQQDAPPVGRIDMLCRDKQGNLVVVELKKAGVTNRTLIDQVTRYMGWVKQHLATRSQKVRGIVVVTAPDEKLTYSAKAIPGLETKCWNLTIRSF